MPVTGATPAIEVVDLVKDFGSHRAVDGVSFSVPPGQVCALLGPNGAGKTTTIHILLGLMLPTSGSARVLGHDVVHDRTAAISRTNFMASYASLPYRTHAVEALRVYAELYGVRDAARAVDAAIELVGIGDLRDKRYGTLSSGQQTLVSVAKALVNDPELLFLDEPTASLDPENSFEIRALLRRVASERDTTIFITSHNMAEVERLADRILFLANGRLIADATTDDLRAKHGGADLEEVFLTLARGSR